MSRGRISQNRPPSPTKQMVLRKYETGLFDVMSVFGQKWSKTTLSIFKFWWENPTNFKNSGFQQQWFFRLILAESYILLYDLHAFLENKSFKNASRWASAGPKVYSYLSEEHNRHNTRSARYHAKMQYLTTSPGRERDSCSPLIAMDFPKVYVLKHIVKKYGMRCKSSEK